jgi:hypothetical protein
MISKPLVQRIAILALRKMRSKASDGKKKSYDETSANKTYWSSATYSVNTEPLRAIAAKCEATETTRSFRPVVDALHDRFQNTENAVHLCERLLWKGPCGKNVAHGFLLHVDDQGSSTQLTNAEELYILIAVELLWCASSMRRWWVGRDKRFDVIGEQGL